MPHPNRSGRWAYLADPRTNPPTNDCPQCVAPSKVHFIGARTEDGVRITTRKCEHGHEWATREPRTTP